MADPGQGEASSPSTSLAGSLGAFRFVPKNLPRLGVDNKSPEKSSKTTSNGEPTPQVTSNGTSESSTSTGTPAHSSIEIQTHTSLPVKPTLSNTPLKLNFTMLKKLNELAAQPAKTSTAATETSTQQKGTAPVKFDRTPEGLEKYIDIVHAVCPRADRMEIQDAILHNRWDISAAIVQLRTSRVRESLPKAAGHTPGFKYKRINSYSSDSQDPMSPDGKTDPTSLAESAEPEVKKPKLDKVSTTTSTNGVGTSSGPSTSNVAMQQLIAMNKREYKPPRPKNYKLSDSSDEEYFNPKSKRQSVLDFLSRASAGELASIPRITAKRAEVIVKARPFKHWNDVCEKLSPEGLNMDTLYDTVTETLRIRTDVSYLMKQCTDLSQSLATKLRSITSASSSSQLKLSEQPKTLTEGLTLAGYQMIGLNWLRLLHDQKVNGILADEMGLGKTIQVIAFLAYLKENGLKKGVHLIIVPSSTIENWLNELARWCSSLVVQPYYGSQEERRTMRFWWRDEKNKAGVEAVDVLLTTYNLVNSTAEDRSFFRKLAVQYVVYDEAHMLKNMTTQRYMSLMKIMAEHRILLTGTPLQNNLIELMSLLIFVMPDLFADHQDDLKQLFKTTKGAEQSSFETDKIRQAKKIMEPFLLRRLKQDVLAELPKKTDENIVCELTSEQRALYDDLLRQFREDSVREVPEEEDPEQTAEETSEPDPDSGKGAADAEDSTGDLSGSMAMMMMLRKTANHPALVRNHYSDRIIKAMAKKLSRDSSYPDKDEGKILYTLEYLSDHQIHQLCLKHKSINSYKLSEQYLLNSGKMEKLDELLPQLQKEGHRVLLFSQFRQALDVLEEYLKVREYKFVRLDGQTPVVERQSLINDYNNDDSIFIFMLSTRAGGFGINLASADTVIIHDIDLNPYNDKQAEDRCHRVGQTRPVKVIRLIGQGTIEETMLKIAQGKLSLEQQITESQGSGTNSKQTEKKLLRLLREALKTSS